MDHSDHLNDPPEKRNGRTKVYPAEDVSPCVSACARDIGAGKRNTWDKEKAKDENRQKN